MSERDVERQPGDEVGLGRVVANPGHLGAEDGTIEEASDESFPASDPPGFMSDPATPSDGETTATPGRRAEPEAEAPNPRDVP